MPDDTYRGLLENISETPGTYKQMLKAIADGGSGGGQWYDYRIDITINGSTVTADYNGASLTEIATAYKDDPSTGILAVLHGAGTYETQQAMVLYASYNTSWGDVASNINFISFIYDATDDKYFVRRTVLAGSGNTTSKKAM